MKRHMNSGRNGEKNEALSKPSHILLFEIAIEMKKTGLSESFIENAVRISFDFEGVADLMKMWKDETDLQEKDEIVADIQDMIDACLQKDKIKKFYVKFNDLDTIAQNIRSFKDGLLLIVNKNGGINHLSDLTGIPQPSLSRFFKSNSMPQRSTLLKIAKALRLSAIKIEDLQFPRQNHM